MKTFILGFGTSPVVVVPASIRTGRGQSPGKVVKVWTGSIATAIRS